MRVIPATPGYCFSCGIVFLARPVIKSGTVRRRPARVLLIGVRNAGRPVTRDEQDHFLRELYDRVDRVEAEIGVTLPRPDRRNGRLTLQERLHAVENDRDATKAFAQIRSHYAGLGTKSVVLCASAVAATAGILSIIDRFTGG